MYMWHVPVGSDNLRGSHAHTCTCAVYLWDSTACVATTLTIFAWQEDRALWIIHNALVTTVIMQCNIEHTLKKTAWSFIFHVTSNMRKLLTISRTGHEVTDRPASYQYSVLLNIALDGCPTVCNQLNRGPSPSQLRCLQLHYCAVL